MAAVTPCIICNECGATIELVAGYEARALMGAHDKVCPAKDKRQAPGLVKDKRRRRRRGATEPYNPFEDTMRTVGEQLGRAGVEWILEQFKRR